MTYTRKKFIEKIAPMAREDYRHSHILASVTIAQAILESNNGNSRLTREGNALFGIKATASWRGKVWNGKTIEYYDGKRETTITAAFRAYDSWKESISDHSSFLASLSRYQSVIGEKNYKVACKALQVAGYATDPQYANKLVSIIEANNLSQYDEIDNSSTDVELGAAVSKIIKSGITLQYNAWKRMDLMELKNVPALINRLGGLEHLVAKGIISQRELWEKKQYKVNHVRSLLIKYANSLK